MIFEAEQKWGTCHAVPNCCRKPIPKFHFLTLPNPDHWVHNKWKIINLLKVESGSSLKCSSYAVMPISPYLLNLCIISVQPHPSTSQPTSLTFPILNLRHFLHPHLTYLLSYMLPQLLWHLDFVLGGETLASFYPPPPHTIDLSKTIGDRRKEE